MAPKKEPLWALSSIPGRVRLRFKEDEKKVPNLDRFLEISGVREVTYNKITKSLLIIYDKEALSLKKLFSQIEGRMSISIMQEEMKSLENPLGEGDKGSLLSQAVYEAAKKTDETFRKGTVDYADIGSLIASALVVTGVIDLFRRPKLPSWDNLLWYGVNIFYWQSRRYAPLKSGGE